MSQNLYAPYRCPKCGATAALLIPEPMPQDAQVVLKCLECAHILRVPRSQLEGAGGPLDSKRSLE